MTTFAPSRKRTGAKKGVPVHPNSLANIVPHQFPKGTNGNPHPGDSLTVKLRRALTEDKVKEFIESTLAGAILREPTAFKEVWDRVEGKVAQPVVGADGGPIVSVNIGVGMEELTYFRAIAQAIADGRLVVPAGLLTEAPGQVIEGQGRVEQEKEGNG